MSRGVCLRLSESYAIPAAKSTLGRPGILGYWVVDMNAAFGVLEALLRRPSPKLMESASLFGIN